MRTTLIIDPESGTIEKRVILTTTVGKAGYKAIRLGAKTCLVHRLIWEHVHGPIPNGMWIDHINRDKADNRITNLRLVTPSQNAQNRPNVLGASFNKKQRKWQAQIGHEGKRYNLGWYEKKEDAERAYAEAAARIHTHNPKASLPSWLTL